jgi:hypothetical protein
MDDNNNQLVIRYYDLRDKEVGWVLNKVINSIKDLHVRLVDSDHGKVEGLFINLLLWAFAINLIDDKTLESSSSRLVI